MMDDAETANMKATAEAIRQFPREWADLIRRSFEAEVSKMEAEGFDPARGRGRGPQWADGG